MVEFFFLFVFANLGFRAKIGQGLGLNMMGFCRENLGFCRYMSRIGWG